MSILIRGMEMPTKGNPITVSIYPDGTAEWEAQHKKGTAVPVPPHGALMDRDDFFATCPELVYGYKAITDDFVVIPAEEAPAKDTNVPTTYDLLYEEGGPDTR